MFAGLIFIFPLLIAAWYTLMHYFSYGTGDETAPADQII